jgi:hypothetical protein
MQFCCVDKLNLHLSPEFKMHSDLFADSLHFLFTVKASGKRCLPNALKFSLASARDFERIDMGLKNHDFFSHEQKAIVDYAPYFLKLSQACQR